jgi:signal recognition particle subunit SRP68
MLMKSEHAAESKGIVGSARSHIISRLHKAATYAVDLSVLLNDRSATGANDADVLEARAYAASLTGAEQFEKQSWENCIKEYSEARVIYGALEVSKKVDTFKDLLTATIDPSIRYAAYQMRIPRTVSIPAIARKYFPESDAELVELVEKLQPGAVRGSSATKVEALDNAPKTIMWRSRQVDLEDASIAAALSSVAAAATKLSEKLSSTGSGHSREAAAAYDDILIASQDAVDATKHAIDELISEGVGQGDKRMQSLQITRTALSYDMISWRVGRNRVLSGENDGAKVESGPVAKTRKSKNGTETVTLDEEGSGRKLAKLREKAVLYDSILQSLDSIKELPGVAADSEFLEEIGAKYSYFQALKYGSHHLAIGYILTCF